MTPESILKECAQSMDKAMEHLKHELRGIRTGRASTALVEYLKVDYYGSPTDLKNIAAITVPEPSQIHIKPFDASALGEIRKAIEQSSLGLNPQSDGKAIRLNIPPLSGDRRKQLAAQVKKLGEDAKVAVRNVRRDANKHADQLSKATEKHYSEDQIADLKDKIQNALKAHETKIDEAVAAKTKEIMEV